MITVEFSDETELLMREVCAHLGGLCNWPTAVLRPEHADRLDGLAEQVASLPDDLDVVEGWPYREPTPELAAALEARPALRWLLANAFTGPLARRFTSTFDEFTDAFAEDADCDPDRAEVLDPQETGPY